MVTSATTVSKYGHIHKYLGSGLQHIWVTHNWTPNRKEWHQGWKSNKGPFAPGTHFSVLTIMDSWTHGPAERPETGSGNRTRGDYKGSYFTARFKAIEQQIVFRDTRCLLYGISLHWRAFPFLTKSLWILATQTFKYFLVTMLDKTLSVSLKIALEKAGDPMLVVLRSDDARTTRGPWTHLHSTELNISTCAFDKLFMLFLPKSNTAI